MTCLARLALAVFLFSASPALASDERPVVVAFGDSLTAGYNLPAGLGFAPQLEDALRRQGVAATVVDGGVSGETTSGGRARLGWFLDGLEEKPDLLVLELGGNDMLRVVDPALTEANLDAMLEELARRDIPVLLAGMRAAPNLDPDYVVAFDALYPALAKRHGVALYPFFMEGVTAVPGMVQADGIHPTFAGIKVIVTGIRPQVLEALGR
ncbi:arylesterase [Sphingomicrobium nitratireducens]|uniref:arylesterase n=1 Tax=Sphingomicrobium nitratireducens TaxID=2964666 RepID=UPI00223ECD94|nr:arylesterase [Sphingomicrobium nitratireducens]